MTCFNFIFKPNLKKIQALESVSKNGLNLENVNYIDYKVCKRAVKQNGFALKFVPDKFMDGEMCLIAVRQNGLALRYVKSKFKNYMICKDAVHQNINAFAFVPISLQSKNYKFN